MLARYVERRLAGGDAPDPAELCRNEPELEGPLRELVRGYESLAGQLDPGETASRSAADWLAALRARRGEGDAEPLAPRIALAPGALLARRYRIRERLGRGGQGEVWRAEDLKLRVEVALKALRADRLDPRALERIRREVTAAREVVSPNVCRIYDLVDAEGEELVSMEYVDGETLYELLVQRGPFALDEATEIAAQMLAGLEAIHAAGLVHRDVKPENVMRTRTGRVVVMDLGLAKALAESGPGTIAGTPAYMAPEQAAGNAVDARADVFAAGVVLAELVDPRGIASPESRRSLWEAVRHSPPAFAETPWQPVLARAVARDPALRYASARELARALEQVMVRASGAEARPYPGLAAFGEQDAAYFFGREAEVEALWQRLDAPPRLHAVVGPSGAGKSSFLRAGVVAARPEGWRALVVTPGRAPFVALGQAVGERLAGDVRAAGKLVRFAEPGCAVELLRHWREQGREALLVVDQFEELFTQSSGEDQRRFAELLGRLPLEADVHVVLGLRDDFLLACNRFDALAPVFSELMPLEAPAGAALRRALTQPAAKCGFRFEDDRLVDEMLAEVEGERGALPLLAFAAASLWDRRDRDTGLLPRAAYASTGGVGGALAGHAEAAIERIGSARLPIVREIFRNLVTAQGTRASRGGEELASVSEDRAAAREVLFALVGARLLTAFETPGPLEDAPALQRVEIIHESLLSAWPRLLRWRTQDADAAQLREQLRQAAQVWAEKGRPEDLLWTGTSFQEYSVWRARYPGRLTDVEQAFGKAMTELAGRRRRRRRWLAAGVAAALIVTTLILALFWRTSEGARTEAELQARRAEASKLLALGRVELAADPTAALAYTLASLERADDSVARRFAVAALYGGPTAFQLASETEPSVVQFSPDGAWLAAGSKRGELELWQRDGGPSLILQGHRAQVLQVLFNARSDRLVSCAADGGIQVRALPGGEVVRAIETGGENFCWLLDGGARVGVATFRSEGAGQRLRVRSWPLEAGPATDHGELGCSSCLVDAVERILVTADGSELRLFRLESIRSSGRLVGEAPSELGSLAMAPDGRSVAVGELETGGEIHLWSLTSPQPKLLRTLQAPKPPATLRFDRSGKALAATGLDRRVWLWHLEGPPDAAPHVLRRDEVTETHDVAFHPDETWLATAHNAGVALWSLRQPDIHVLGEPESPRIMGLALAPDDSWIAACVNPGPIRFFPTSAKASVAVRSLPVSSAKVAVHPDGNRVLAGAWGPLGAPFVVSLDRNEPRSLGGFASQVWALAFSRDGRLAAAGGGFLDPREGLARVWDLAAGTSRVLDPGDGRWVNDLEFLPDGSLLMASASGVRHWHLDTGTFEVLHAADRKHWTLAVDRAGRHLLSAGKSYEGMAGEELLWQDLETRESRVLPAFGTTFTNAALDPRGEVAVTADFDGVVRVGRVDGGEPHLLYGHRRNIWEVAVTSDGRSIVSAGDDGTVRIWPMPDVTQPPLHVLPYEELLAKLRSLTNLRVVADPSSPTGYATKAGPFDGWKEAPRWIALVGEETPP